MMDDPLGSSRVSSQKQNREGVVGAQSGQYRATVVERARDVVDPGSGCDSVISCFVSGSFSPHWSLQTCISRLQNMKFHCSHTF